MPRCSSLELIHADPWLLALAKPSGLLSQPGLGNALADSLLSRAQRRWPEVRLVHRLDRDTSGLILLARDAETHRRLSAAFAERRIRKTRQDMPDRTSYAPEERRRRKLVRRSHFMTIIAAWIITVPAAALLSAILFVLINTAVG